MLPAGFTVRLRPHNSWLRLRFYNRIRWNRKKKEEREREALTPSLCVWCALGGGSLSFGILVFGLVLVSKRGRVLFMAANYSLSSAPGQACAWRVRPHFRTGWRRRIGGRERRKNVNPPPHLPSLHEKSPNSPVRHPSSCQMKWCRPESLSVVTECECVCVCVWTCMCASVEMADRWIG